MGVAFCVGADARIQRFPDLAFGVLYVALCPDGQVNLHRFSCQRFEQFNRGRDVVAEVAADYLRCPVMLVFHNISVHDKRKRVSPAHRINKRIGLLPALPQPTLYGILLQFRAVCRGDTGREQADRGAAVQVADYNTEFQATALDSSDAPEESVGDKT